MRRLILVMLMVITLPGIILLPADPSVHDAMAAQGEANTPASGEMFDLGIVAANCQQVPTTFPFQGGGCVPAEGAVITVTSESGEPVGSCIAEREAPGAPIAGCTIAVPYGSVVVVTQDASTVPAGYAPTSNPQRFEVPNAPPDGIVGGPVFINLPVENGESSRDVVPAEVITANDDFGYGCDEIDDDYAALIEAMPEPESGRQAAVVDEYLYADIDVMTMRPSEMRLMAEYLDEWAWSLEEMPVQDIPPAVDEYHNRVIDALGVTASMLNAVAAGGVSATQDYGEVIEEIETDIEFAEWRLRRYCGEQWTSVFGDNADASMAPTAVSDPTALAGNDITGSFTLSNAPFFSDGQPWGSLRDRLGYQDGAVIFSGNPDGFSLSRDGVELHTVANGNSQGIAICTNGECVNRTTDSGNGNYVDQPIGWIDDRLIYQRIEDSDITIRAIEWNGTPLSDQQIGMIDTAVSPLGMAYPIGTGTLIPTSSSWLLISEASVHVVDGNPYGEIGLVRTNFAVDLISYVAGGELVIASVSSPGSAIDTIPFNGVDYDLSPDAQSVVISTGSSIEIYARDGSLVGASDRSIQTGSVVWLSIGIVFIDQTNEAIRLLDPATLMVDPEYVEIAPISAGPTPEPGNVELGHVLAVLDDQNHAWDYGRTSASTDQLSPTGQQLTLGNASLYVFIFSGETPEGRIAAREQAADAVDLDTMVLSTASGQAVSEGQPLHMAEASNVITILVGGDQELADQVSDALADVS